MPSPNALQAGSLEFTYRWVDSIYDISIADWKRCFASDKFSQSYSYQQAVEDSAPPSVVFNYLIISDHENVQAILGCFRYRISLSTIATGTMRRIINFIESFIPHLFSINGFFVGQLTAVCDHLYGFGPIPEKQRTQLLTECEPHIRKQARALRTSFIIHKEIPAKSVKLAKKALESSYLIAPSLPEMTLTLRTSKPYPTQLRKKYRNHYRRRQNLASNKGLEWRVERGRISSQLAKQINHLYSSTYERSNAQFERLSPRYFESVMKHCPEASLVLYYDKDDLVGFMLNISSHQTFHGLYLGYNTNYRSAALYFNLIYQSLELAQSDGYKTIALGQTSYEIKSALGAEFSELYLAIQAHNPVVHELIKLFKNQLFPKTHVPKRRAFHVVQND